MRVAVLDRGGVLVGTRNVAKPKKTDVDAGDLPTNGKYFWDGKKFVPVGFGRGKVVKPPVDKDRAIYLFMRAILNDKPVPQECYDWLAWYERHLG